MDLNYDPRCSIYLNGKYYYLSYYLPNGKRILKSLSISKRMLAKKKMHLKEQELYEGIFEDHDILKMPEIRVSPQVRVDLNLGVEKYLDASGVKKIPELKTTINTLLNRWSVCWIRCLLMR